MDPIDIIVSGIVVALVTKLLDKFLKKKDNMVSVPVSLPYTRTDLLYLLAFVLLAIPAWGFALWVFFKAGFNWKQLLMCVLVTLGGLAALFSHIVSRQVRLPRGREELAQSVKCITAKTNRQLSLFCFPFMASYMVSQNPSLFGVSWDFDWVCLSILLLAVAIAISRTVVYSKKFHVDISDVN